jgi:hypothetical protein
VVISKSGENTRQNMDTIQVSRFFSGKDASRSFVDGCFKDDCFDAEKSLSGLTKKQVGSLEEWKSFYDKESKYKFVGTLQGWSMGKLADE